MRKGHDLLCTVCPGCHGVVVSWAYVISRLLVQHLLVPVSFSDSDSQTIHIKQGYFTDKIKYKKYKTQRKSHTKFTSHEHDPKRSGTCLTSLIGYRSCHGVRIILLLSK